MRLVALSALLLLALPGSSGGQEAADSVGAPVDTVRVPGVPVVVRGDTLFRVYGRLGPLNVTARAAAIASRIDSASRTLTQRQDSVRVVEAEGQVVIMVGDAPIMAVLPADAGQEGVSEGELATRYAAAITTALTSTAFLTQLRAFGIGLLKTLATVAVLLGILWLLRGVYERSIRLFGFLRQSKRIPSFRVQELELISADKIADALVVVAKVTRGVVLAVLGYLFVVFVLGYFPWTEAASGRILDYVLGPLGTVGRAILDYLPNLLFIAVIVLVTRYFLRFIHFLFNAVGSGAVTIGGFEREWAEPTYKLVRFLVLAFALIALFPYLPGSKSDAFKGVSLFVGVLFSLGSTGAVANLVAGTLLTYSRSFQVGDRVRIGDTLGDVVSRSLLVTKVRTVYNVEVSIPNSKVMSGEVFNYTTLAKTTGVILQSTITIGYDVPWRTVHELLTAAALSTEGVESEPPPFVVQTGLSDYYPAYELNAFVRDAARMRLTLSALNERIQDVFAEAGVEITSPAYTAVRDGSAAAIPAEHLPPDYRPPPFRVQQVGTPGSRAAPPPKGGSPSTGPDLFEG